MSDFSSDIVLEFGLDPSKFNRSLDSVDRRHERFTRSSERNATRMKQRMVSSFDSVEKKGVSTFGRLRKASLALRASVVAAAAVIATKLSTASSSAARDAEETQSKFDVVFRGYTDDAEAIASAMATNLGRAESSVKSYLSTLQDTFVPLGFARSQSVALSEAVARLGLDLASFNNQADAETINLLTSAIIGNHEAVRRYGISLSQANVDQKLMEMGFRKSTQGATAQQKAMARLALMTEMTTDAQGDLRRTQGSAENQFKRLDERVKEVREEIGNELNRELLDMIERMGGAEEVAKNLGMAMKAVAGATNLVIRSVSELFTTGAGPALEWLFNMDEADQVLKDHRDMMSQMREAEATSTQEALLKAQQFQSAQDDELRSRATGRIQMYRDEQDMLVEAWGESREKINGLLDETEGRYREHISTLAALDQERAGSRDRFDEDIFRVGLSGKGSVEEQLGALRSRAAEFRQEANTAFAGNQFEAARDALREMADVILEINRVEGGSFAGIRQEELAAVAQEMDALFSRSIESEEALASAAHETTQELKAELAAAEASIVTAKDQLTLFDEQLQAISKKPIEELREEFDKLAASIAKAGIADPSIITEPHREGPFFLGAASGGMADGLPAASDPRDVIPALLRRGETVLTPEQSAALAPALQQAGVPGFAGGGNVGFKQLIQGTRSFTGAFNAAADFDRRMDMRSIGQQRGNRLDAFGFKQTALLDQLAPIRSMHDAVAPGFFEGAGGGRAQVGGGDVSVKIDNITIGAGSGDALSSDSIAASAQIRRDIQRGLSEPFDVGE